MFDAARGASAKTAVGVTEAFNDVVALIIDTPSLWHEEKPNSLGRIAAANTANTTAVSGPHHDTVESMAGNIALSQAQDEVTSVGCLC